MENIWILSSQSERAKDKSPLVWYLLNMYKTNGVLTVFSGTDCGKGIGRRQAVSELPIPYPFLEKGRLLQTQVKFL